MKDYILDLDKPRELRFGFKALRLIRQKFGNKSIDQLMNIQIDEIPQLVWAGLKWGEPSLTVERVEEMLDESIPKNHTIMGIIEVALEALSKQMGVDVKKAGADIREAEKKKAGAEPEKEKKKEVKLIAPSKKTQKK